MNDILRKHGAELRRALANRHYEETPTGLRFPRMGVFIGGHFEAASNQPGQPTPKFSVGENILVTEGLNYLADVALSGGSQLSSWYIAPYTASITPGASLTAATFTATSTEFTNYDEATRVQWVDAGPTAGVISNDASPALFTIAAGGGTVRGAGLISASAKSSVAGKLVAAANFASAKVLAEDEELRIKYVLTFADDGA